MDAAPAPPPPSPSSAASSAAPPQAPIDFTISYAPSSRSISAAHQQSIWSIFHRNMAGLYQTNSLSSPSAAKFGPKEKREKVAELLDPAESRYLLITAPGEVLAGYTHFRLCFDADADPGEEEGALTPCLYVFEIQVDPAFAGCGLGRRMMELCEAMVKSVDKSVGGDKIEKITLTVFKANLGAIRFYRKLGYGLDENDPSRWEEGEDGDPGWGEEEGGEEEGGGEGGEGGEGEETYFILSKAFGRAEAMGLEHVCGLEGFPTSGLDKFLDKFKMVK
ncbi:hypothetical protein TeGR_g3147 [Tetraparma gracilis]|uniref:N-alpha-acetyltransferase 40 n=1 Tax=Tetraparma gracilis TaxID=2962635 RepID=A0ABQ6MJD8_9STRA|nr:hypothetical protein TeGR_g3147 [Tetraparma gracilis]